MHATLDFHSLIHLDGWLGIKDLESKDINNNILIK